MEAAMEATARMEAAVIVAARDAAVLVAEIDDAASVTVLAATVATDRDKRPHRSALASARPPCSSCSVLRES